MGWTQDEGGLTVGDNNSSGGDNVAELLPRGDGHWSRHDEKLEIEEKFINDEEV